MNLDAQIEAILFFKGEPVTKQKLAELLAVRVETINEALANLGEKLAGHGLTIIENGAEVMLGTAPAVSELIEKIKKEELDKDLGKAGVETLAIVLYHGPISRPDIDYLRGVNSSFILRHLLIRGLVERIANPTDARGYLYQPTLELLSYLGLTKLEDLPDFETVKNQIATFTQNKESANPSAESNPNPV